MGAAVLPARFGCVAVCDMTAAWTDHRGVLLTASIPRSQESDVPLDMSGIHPRRTPRPHYYLDPRSKPYWPAYRDSLESRPFDPRFGTVSDVIESWNQRVLDALVESGIAGYRPKPLNWTYEWPNSLEQAVLRQQRAFHRLQDAQRFLDRHGFIDDGHLQRLEDVWRECRRWVRRWVSFLRGQKRQNLRNRGPKLSAWSPWRYQRFLAQHVLRLQKSTRSPPALAVSATRDSREAIAIFTTRMRFLYERPALSDEQVQQLPPELRPAALKAQREFYCELSGAGAGDPDSLNRPVTPEDVAKARRSLRTTSITDGATSMADMRNSGLPGGEPSGEDMNLAAMMERVMNEPVTPSIYVARASPLHKGKGDIRDVEGYRFLAIGTPEARIFQQVVLDRLTTWIEAEGVLTDEAAAYRRHRSTIDHILMSASLSARAAADLRILYVLYVDFRRAFPSVDHDMLLCHLWELGIRGRLWCRLHEIYSNAVLYASLAGHDGPPVSVLRGVREGDAVSAILFTVYVHMLVRALRAIPGVVGMEIPGWGELRSMSYADDFRLLVTRPEAIPAVAAVLESVSLLATLSQHGPEQNRFFYYCPLAFAAQLSAESCMAAQWGCGASGA